MPFMHRMKPFRLRKGGSQQRKGLQTAILEGIPATIIGNILGGPILTAYLLFMNASSQTIGFVLAIPPLANILQLVAAFVMQRMENRKLWMALVSIVHRTMWVATGAIPFVLPQPYQVPVFIVMFLISYMHASIGGVVWASLVSDMVPAHVRGRYFGIRNTIHWAFASISLLLGGQILERAVSQQAGFAIIFGIAAVCTVWNAVELFKYPNPPFEKSSEKSGIRQLLRPIKDRSFMMATAFIAFFILLQNIAVPLFSFVMLDVLHVSYTQLTIVTTVQMIVMMVSYYYWGNLNARYKTITLLLWSLPIIALSCLLWIGMEFLPVIVVLLLVHVALGIGLGGYNLLNFNFVIGDTPKAERPMYIGLFAALTGLTGFIGPMIGGAVYEAIGDGPEWLLRYGVSFCTGIGMIALAVGVGPFILAASKRQARLKEEV